MQVTIDAVNEFARLRGQLSDKARAAFEQAVLALNVDWENPETVQLLHTVAQRVMDVYGMASAELGARWLELCSDGAAAAVLSVADSERRLHSGLGWLWKQYADGERTEGELLGRCSERMGESVLSAADETMFGSLPRKTLYTRVASPTACAFCRLLAADVRVWDSKEKAAFESHGGCSCVSVPYARPTDIAGYMGRFEENRAMYDSAVAALNASVRDPELQRRLDEAKASHSSRTDSDWTSTNSILVAMRWQEGLEH